MIGRAGKSCHETSHFIGRTAIQVWSQGDSLKVEDKDAKAIFRGFSKARSCLDALRSSNYNEIKGIDKCKHKDGGKSVLDLLDLNRITAYLDPYGCGNGVLHGLMEGLTSWYRELITRILFHCQSPVGRSGEKKSTS